MDTSPATAPTHTGFTFETACPGNVSATDTWLTPPYIVDALGTFELDPCAAPAPRPWQFAPNDYDITQGQDGTVLPWSGRAWCNPPYGKLARPFIDRSSIHPDGGITLIFARTETSVWQDIIWPRATGILFLAGRLSFYKADGTKGGTAGSPSALVAFTDADAGVLRHCGQRGAFFPLPSAYQDVRYDRQAKEDQVQCDQVERVAHPATQCPVAQRSLQRHVRPGWQMLQGAWKAQTFRLAWCVRSADRASPWFKVSQARDSFFDQPRAASGALS